MESVVDREDLLEVIKKNREQHTKIFEEAVEGYRTQAIKMLEAHIQRVKTGNLIEVSVRIPRPEDHTLDYDRVIRMLEMTSTDPITLSEHEFAEYVMDDWNWKRHFLESNSAYSTTAARLSSI